MILRDFPLARDAQKRLHTYSELELGMDKEQGIGRQRRGKTKEKGLAESRKLRKERRKRTLRKCKQKNWVDFTVWRTYLGNKLVEISILSSKLFVIFHKGRKWSLKGAGLAFREEKVRTKGCAWGLVTPTHHKEIRKAPLLRCFLLIFFLPCLLWIEFCFGLDPPNANMISRR